MLYAPNIDPVAIHLGPLAVRWYGLAYLSGFVLAWLLATRRARRADSPVTPAQVEDIIFSGAMGVILGGRCGYVLFYNFDKFLHDPLWLLRVWEGGMSFHGGALGVIIAMVWYARRQRLHFGQLWDFIAPLVPLGLLLGRLANFINQELWGRPSDVPWAMVFPLTDPQLLARHPSQLYEALLEGVALFAILWIFSRKPRPTFAVGGLFLFFYGVFRFGVEFLREPDEQIGFAALGWMSRGQELSLPMILAGAGLFIYAYTRKAPPLDATRQTAKPKPARQKGAKQA
ncbi:MAG TPA: prolipoprotein diacylglyceryl transferase [Spongiibacteraceae bacterium]|nr:prolipoprotein diacylglyceryl transferase [Spongiibacteraceae bacterium]